MKFRSIFDWIGGLSSIYLLPTIAFGVSSRGGWCYLLWLHGRLGLFWTRT